MSMETPFEVNCPMLVADSLGTRAVGVPASPGNEFALNLKISFEPSSFTKTAPPEVPQLQMAAGTNRACSGVSQVPTVLNEPSAAMAYTVLSNLDAEIRSPPNGMKLDGATSEPSSSWVWLLRSAIGATPHVESTVKTVARWPPTTINLKPKVPTWSKVRKLFEFERVGMLAQSVTVSPSGVIW